MIITEITLENAPEQKDLNVQIKKSMEYLVPKREGGGGLTKAFIMKLQKTKDMKMILKASREGKKKKVTRKGSASSESSNHGSGALEILRIKNSASNQTVHLGQWQRNYILRQARPGKRTSSPAPLLQQPRDAARGPSSEKNPPRSRVYTSLVLRRRGHHHSPGSQEVTGPAGRQQSHVRRPAGAPAP